MNANARRRRTSSSRIAGAVLHRLPPGPKSSILDPEPVPAAVRSFLGIAPTPAPSDTVLATVLFTDIVDSTQLQARLGDRRWKELAEQHHSTIRDRAGAFRRHRAGHGRRRLLRAVRRACSRDQMWDRGCRGGQATGHRDPGRGPHGRMPGRGRQVRRSHGLDRCPRLGEGGGVEVLVSQTVKDLVAGSGLSFEDAGEHELKGVPGPVAPLPGGGLTDEDSRDEVREDRRRGPHRLPGGRRRAGRPRVGDGLDDERRGDVGGARPGPLPDEALARSAG